MCEGEVNLRDNPVVEGEERIVVEDGAAIGRRCARDAASANLDSECAGGEVGEQVLLALERTGGSDAGNGGVAVNAE